MAIHEIQIDALLPADMAAKVEQVGYRKARLDPLSTFTLAVLAGTFIALGAVFSTVVAAGPNAALPYGLSRLLGGLVFSLGLILVLVGGAELFTGNNLIVMAWASGQVSTRRLLNNWGLVYLGNFVGALGAALLVYLSGQYGFGNGAVGAAALSVASSKTSLDFVPALALGVLCNILVCLAVWLTFSARSTTDRILAIIPPIAAFVAAGFEHSIANMYFIPIGLLIKAGAPAPFWLAIGRTAADFPMLTWANFFLRNLVPVTIGNIIGGALVGVVYWSVYLRPQRQNRSALKDERRGRGPEDAIAGTPLTEVATLLTASQQPELEAGRGRGAPGTAQKPNSMVAHFVSLPVTATRHPRRLLW